MISLTGAPLVSVVIPVKNGALLIAETILSVTGQSFNNIEIIVVDDASTDSTVNVVSEFVERDNRIRLINNTSGRCGAPVCRNIGWNNAKGKYLIFLDGDDLLDPECIENRVKVFEANKDMDFLVFQAELFHKIPGDTKIYWNYFSNEDDLDRFLKVDAPFHTMGPIWQLESIKKINGWDENAMSWQDWEFHIRALIAGLLYKKIPEADCYYRKGVEGSISSGDSSKERCMYFAQSYCNIYRYLEAGSLLTINRKRYILWLFIHLCLLSVESNGVFFSYKNIMKKILLINLINKGRLLEIFGIILFITYFKNNRVIGKLAWLRMKEYYIVSEQRKNRGILRSKVLSV